MPPSHTTSTVFPYTPLFRSNIQTVIAIMEGLHKGVYRFQIGEVQRNKFNTGVGHLLHNALICLLCLRGVTRPKDRKSTRVNSSHVEISYAVVCLKQQRTGKV